jgi:hypothetical protein
MRIYCCTCGKEKECELVDGTVIYPHRPDLAQLNFYRCPSCKQYIGCHPNSIKPLGVIPTQEMKRARMIIHSMIDPLWKSGKISRGKLYRLIAKELGLREYHTGWTKNIKQCRDTYRAVSKVINQIGTKQ